MRFKWYIDIFFLVNFTMDAFLLLLMGTLLKLPTTLPRIAAAGFVGAAASCLAVYLWYLPAILTWIIGILLPGCAMIWIAFRPGRLRSFIKMLIMLFFEAFSIGGIMEALYQHTRAGSYKLQKGMPILIWLLLAAGSWFAFRFLWLTISEIKKERQTLYSLTLKSGETQASATGYLDTGNCLYDLTGKRPVHIVSENLWKKLWKPGTDCIKIPFHTIGSPLGVMEAMEIEQMECRGEGGRRQTLSHPLIARAPFQMTREGSYDVLLHKETM